MADGSINYLFMIPDRKHMVDAQCTRWMLTHDPTCPPLDLSARNALLDAVDEYLEALWQEIRDDPTKNTSWRIQPEGALTPYHITLTWNPFGDSTFADAYKVMAILFAMPSPTRAAFANTPLAEPPPQSLMGAPQCARDWEAVRYRARAADFLICACEGMDQDVLQRSFVALRTPRGGCPAVLTADQTRLLLLEREFIARWLHAHQPPAPPEPEEGRAPGCGAWLARRLGLAVVT